MGALFRQSLKLRLSDVSSAHMGHRVKNCKNNRYLASRKQALARASKPG